MKTIANLLLAGGLALTTAFTAPSYAQHCHGYDFHAGPGRYLRFECDGRPFVFDRTNGDIFCNGVRIGFRNAAGEVTLINGAMQQINAVAPASTVVPAAGGAAVVPAPAPAAVGAVAPAAGAAVVPGTVQPAAGGAVAPAAGGAVAPAAGGAVTPVGAGGAVAPAQAPAGGAAIPAPAAAPANPARPVPALGSGNDPAAAALAVPAASIDIGMLSGQWRSESKDIAGRTVVRELNFDDEKNATLRVQVQGQEPLSVTGPFTVKGTELTVMEGEETRLLGQLTTSEKDRLIIKGEGETLVFSRPQI